MYRRLNVEIEGLVPWRTQRTLGPVRRVLSEGALQRGVSERIRLPSEHLPWVRAESQRQVTILEAAGYDVSGDLAWLVPDERDTGPWREVDGDELAAAAVATLARFAVRTLLSPTQDRGASPARRTDPQVTVPGRRARWRDWFHRGAVG